ncbi:MAG: hypothetical protein P1U74_09940 [Legionellaceae bacterium]|nr:hypothetical protein [Legionellaceae bacterium]
MSIVLAIAQSNLLYFVDPNIPERQLPFGEVDNYQSCLHPSYANEVMAWQNLT